MERDKESTEKVDKEIGLRIKLLRKAKGWRQKHLAAEVDESMQVISNIERAYTHPTTNQLRKLAKALDTTTDFILGVTADPSPHSATDAPTMIDLKKALEEETIHWGGDLVSNDKKELIKKLIAVVIETE